MALRAQFGVFEVVGAFVIYTSKKKKRAMMTPALIIISHYHSFVWPIISSLFCVICVDDSRRRRLHNRVLISSVPHTFSVQSLHS